MIIPKQTAKHRVRILILLLCTFSLHIFPAYLFEAFAIENRASTTQEMVIHEDKFAPELYQLWKVPSNARLTLNVGFGRRFTSLAEALEAVSGWIIPGSSAVVMKLDGQRFRSEKPVLIRHPYATQIHIEGEKSTTLKPKALLSVSGGPTNWLTTIQFDSTARASVGDYLIALTTSGSGDHEILRGVQPVLKVEGSNVTVRNTGWFSSFPSLTLDGGLFVLVKSVLRFENSDGIVVAGSHAGLLKDVVVEGNSDDYWDRDRVEKTEKGTHGIIVGSATLYSSNPESSLKQGANPYGVGASSISLGPYVGVFGFDQQGILSAQSSSVFASSSASSNNKRSGYYSDTSSSIWAKSSVASGNYLTGYTADNNANIIASSKSSSVGNNGVCVFAQASSHINIGESVIKLCNGGGVVAQNSSLAQIEGARIGPFPKDAKAVFFQHGATVNGDNVSISGATVGIHGAFGGVFRGGRSVRIEKCGLAIRADSSIMQIKRLDLSDNVSKYLITGNASVQVDGEYIQFRDRLMRQ